MIAALIIGVRMMLTLVTSGPPQPRYAPNTCVQYDVCVSWCEGCAMLCTEPEPCE